MSSSISSQELWSTYASVYARVLPAFSEYQQVVDWFCQSQQSSAYILDIGCGPGLISQALAKSGKTVVGIDYNESMISAATSGRTANTYFFTANALRLPFADESFEGVVSHNMLYCIADPVQALREMLRVLKKGGKLTISGPGPDCDVGKLNSTLIADVARAQDVNLQSDLDVFFECNRQITHSELLNLYSNDQLSTLLLSLGFSKIIEKKEPYLGQNHFITAQK